MDSPVHTARPVTGAQELKSALVYIAVGASVVWLPLVIFVIGIPDPWNLFSTLKGIGASLMFVVGAIIANSTAVGGGMVFNPTLQLVFGVNGFSALILAIMVQCSGMASGAFGWYKKGEFFNIDRRDLMKMIGATSLLTAVWTVCFIEVKQYYPAEMLLAMKIASMLVSFYVFVIVFASIRERESHIRRLEDGIESGNADLVIKEARELDEIDHPNTVPISRPVKVDKRIYGWLVLGALLNVSTAVGVGELVFSHLIKYYKAAPKTSVAVGTLLQAVSVMTQAVFILIFLRDLIIIDFICIGLLFCMIGGRLAPYILSRRAIEPYVKHILAFAALSMGVTSGAMLLLSLLK